jgi:hypothetical protein
MMAKAVQREPTEAGKAQMQTLFGKLLAGDPVFLPKERYRSWYGIDNDRAVGRFVEAWEEYCNASDAGKVKLLSGRLATPSGYVIVRKDSLFWKDAEEKGWLYNL